jgi:hypothetical protein
MKTFIFIWSCLIGLGSILHGATYHSVKVADLEFGADAVGLKEALENPPYSTFGNAAVHVRCLQECYAASPWLEGANRAASNQGGVELVFRLENDEPLKGFIDLRAGVLDWNDVKLKPFPFTFTPGPESASTKERFDEIRSLQSDWLAKNHLPGTAWFRNLAGPEEAQNRNRNWRTNELSDSFALFSGGRAISENLALDRELILGEDKDGKTVPLSEIKGVTVKAIDWSSRLSEGDVKVDALSLAIPENQHAVFVKSLPELLALIDRAERELIPASQAYSVRNPFRQMARRYKKQMGLDVAAVAARLLPAKSVAVTGGDPFMPMGSDIAVLMETDSPELLFKAMLKVIESKASDAGASETKFLGKGFQYKGFESKDRSFSSHVWQMGDVVAVSNSLVQIERLKAVADKKESALGATDEFRFFRNRYPLDAKRSAFVFLSDAAIRRWAGPELRIAASRRTRAFAALGQMTSQALAGGKVTDEYESLLGETLWEGGQMISASYGTMNFMKPSSELGIDTVTEPEKLAYERWRSGYERGWSQVFDPIAISIQNEKEKLGIDLSVMPLTVGSDFEEFIQLCGKAELSDMARWVPDESLLHVALAMDTKGERFRKYNEMLIEFLPGLEINPLAWMTGSVSFDLEKSLFWEASSYQDFERFLNTPLLVRIGSNSRLKLALFMTAIKGMMDTSAPDSVKWQTRKSDAGSYVVVSGEEDEIGSNAQLYYATLPNALLVSLREDILLRAMRREKHKLTEDESKSLPAPTQMMLDSSPRFLAGLEGLFDSTDPVRRVQEESWKALPILNEWHRMFPDKDPVAVQVLHYGEDVFCPGGKGYRWNPGAMTMESVAFGFPAAPRTEPAAMPGIFDFGNVSTRLRFQDDGLRAAIKLGETPARLPTPGRGEMEPVVLATAADLVPLKEGVTLCYKGRSYGSDLTMKIRIENIAKEGEQTTFEENSEWIEDGEGTHSYSAQYILDGALMQKSGSGEDDSTVFETPAIELPEKLVAGAVTSGRSAATSKWKDDEGETNEMKFRNEFEVRVIGKEDIEVPAGKFNGCIKIEVISESLEDGEFSHSKYVKWYHPGTGLVKSEAVEGEEDMIELVEIIAPAKGE